MIDPRWAWEPYRPTDQNPWDLRKAGHLYRRAAFGATWDELQAAVADGPETAVDKLLRGRDDAAFEKQCSAPWPRARASSTTTPSSPRGGSTAWSWASPHPLREKMTLFWHNHFATSNAKVRNAGYMLGDVRPDEPARTGQLPRPAPGRCRRTRP